MMKKQLITLFLITVVLVSVLGAVGMTTAQKADALAKTSSLIRITSPRNNARVGYITDVYGTSHNIPRGRYAWVVVYVKKVNMYYQQWPLSFRPNGDWSSKVHLGTPSIGVGIRFDIAVVLANENAHRALMRYQISNEAGHGCPGMVHLPKGAVIEGSVTVIRTR